MASLDMSGYNSFVGFRGGTKINGPFDSSYEDIISFLNGRGFESGYDLNSLLAAAANFGASWSIGINADDKIEIKSNNSFRIRFRSSSTLDGNADVLGIGTDWVLSSVVSGLDTAVAPSDFIRGEVVAFAYDIEERISGTASFIYNFTGGAQDLIVALRVRGNGDIDDNQNTLEDADRTAAAAQAGPDDTRWYINDSGKVVNSSITGTALIWDDLNFRNFLGFTGAETTQLINGYSVLTASNYCNAVLMPSRPYQRHHLSVENVAQARRKIGGGYVSNRINNYITSILDFDLDARLDLIDLYQHFINKFLPYVSRGERINFYQVVGDSRRMMIAADANEEQPAHDLIFTSSRNGFEGRIRGSLVTDQFNLAFPRNLRRRVPVSLRIEHL
jgi:hypothetical protein